MTLAEVLPAVPAPSTTSIPSCSGGCICCDQSEKQRWMRSWNKHIYIPPWHFS
jgi:hypothetical protein